MSLVWLLSPYHGGSHAAWAEGWRRRSRHRIELLSLPARFWKWRMHGGALTLARRCSALPAPEVVVATDMLDLTTFVALTRPRTARAGLLLYMHENQLTYPLPEDPAVGPMRRQRGERDLHYGFINIASAAAADRVAFNSAYHRRSFLAAARSLLRRLPEQRETDLVDRIAARSLVLAPGIEPPGIEPPGTEAPGIEPPRLPTDRPAAGGRRVPLLLWNQRWEYDKNPEQLFAVLGRLADAGVDFRLALCGERFTRRPVVFEQGIRRLGDRVVHVGFLPRERYERLLGTADVVVSTARHEFFGVAVAEAIAAGALPLLPARLAYPELLPEAYHARCLYADGEELYARLRALLTRPAGIAAAASGLAEAIVRRFSWERLAPRYDALVDELSARGPRRERAASGRRGSAPSAGR